MEKLENGHQSGLQNGNMPQRLISSNSEIKRLRKKIDESLDDNKLFNALYYVALLNLALQKKIGTIRFEERVPKG